MLLHRAAAESRRALATLIKHGFTMTDSAVYSGRNLVPPEKSDVFTLWTCGNNFYGQLGVGHFFDVTTPQRVLKPLAGKPISAVALGYTHSILALTDGSVYTWGCNERCQLGRGEAEQDSIPKIVRGLRGRRVVQVQASHEVSFFLTDEHEIFACGSNEHQLLGRDGGDPEAYESVPHPVDRPTTEGNVCAISAGVDFALALTDKGEVVGWGSQRYGQLGAGEGEAVASPVVLKALSSRPMTQIACGWSHALALSPDGGVYSWGNGTHGQLGLGEKVKGAGQPRKVEHLEHRAVAVACGGAFSAALTEFGEVYTWGDGEDGKTGHIEETSVFKPKLVEGLPEEDRVVQIACGLDHMLALTASNEVWSWGFNASGQLGLGDTDSRPAPTRVSFFDESPSRIHRVVAGVHMSAFLADYSRNENWVKELQV